MFSKFMQKLAAGQPVTLRNPSSGEIAFHIGAKLFTLSTDQPLVITAAVPRAQLYQATELHARIKAGMVLVD
jgi:hypothetical protein